MSVVWDLPIEPTQKLLLLAIADHADDAGFNAYPSIARLAERCTISERTVQRALRALEKDGWIAVQRRATRYQPTCYRVSLDGPSKAPKEVPEVLSEDAARGDNLAPLEPSGVTPEVVRGDTGVASGVTPVSPEPSLNRPRTKSAGDTPPAPPAERFELGGFIEDYAEITGGILPPGLSARPLRDVARAYGLEVARAGWRDYVASRHREARPAKAAWFAEEAGRWCKRATGRPAPNPAAPRHPLWGWVREHTPQRRNDPDSGYRAWLCAECEAKRLVPTERDGYGREVPAPPGKVYIARHEAFDPSLVGKCPAELGYDLDGWGRVVGIAEVRRAK